jgi:hypothetical protein
MHVSFGHDGSMSVQAFRICKKIEYQLDHAVERNRRESPVTALNRKLSHLDGDVLDARDVTYHRNVCRWRIRVRCLELKELQRLKNIELPFCHGGQKSWSFVPRLPTSAHELLVKSIPFDWSFDN